MRTFRRTGSSEALDRSHRNHPRITRRQGTVTFRRGWINIALPNELWGAASLALKLYRQKNGTIRHKASTALAAISVSQPYDNAPGKYPASVADALDYKPILSGWEETLCILVSAATAVAVYVSTHPPAFSFRYAAAMAAVCAIVLSLTRAWLLERHYKAVQRTEIELAGPGAMFIHHENVPLYVSKAVGPSSASGQPVQAAIHCLHGFGASTFSWSFVQQELARRTAAVVTAHDLPGFGFSARPRTDRPYTLHFNGAAARAILELQGKELDSQGLHKKKKVLIGHSMGGAAAAEGAIQDPESVSALVLVAPAIVALWMGIRSKAKGNPIAQGAALVEEFVGAEDPPGAVGSDGVLDSDDSEEIVRISGSMSSKTASLKKARPLGRVVAALVHAVFSEFLRLGLFVCTPILVLFLRHIVRSKSFWERGLAAAWVDKSRVTPQYVDAYRLGQLVRGWEGGILRFLSGRFSENASLWHATIAALAGDGHLSQAERLAAACQRGGIKVLIIHGKEDALVPVSNSRRLARLLPNATLVELEACGHMPHEECAERFVEEVCAFVATL